MPYYRATIGNPIFRQFLAEWTPPTLPTPLGCAFFLLAAAAVVLVARRPRDLTLFEHTALAFTLVGGLLAIRSILWFAYACIVFLPPLLPSGRSAPSRPTTLLAIGTSAVAVAVGIGTVARPGQWLTRAWPDEAAAAVTRAAASDPSAKILTDGGVGDWLLYVRPSLRGRIAFDGRWELLPRAQMRTTFLYLWQIGAGWERASRGYRLLVLSPQAESRLVDTYDRRGLRVLYRDRNIVVYDRRASASSPIRNRTSSPRPQPPRPPGTSGRSRRS